MGPPGSVARCERQFPGANAPGSEKLASARTTVPSAPERTSRCAARDAPSRRKACPTCSVTPARSHAAAMRRAAASSGAIGFSTNTCRPRSAAASASASWLALGVATTTASTLRSSSSASSVGAASHPSSRAAASRASAARA